MTPVYRHRRFPLHRAAFDGATKWFSPLVCAIPFSLLSACATPSQLIADGNLQLTTADAPNYDFKLSVRNYEYPNWSGDKKDDRQKMASALLSERCPKMQVIEEVPVPAGRYTTGREATIWVMKIKCSP